MDVSEGVAYTMLAAEIGDRNPRFVLLQNPDDLFFRKPLALHALAPGLGQNELQTGLSPRGKVNASQRSKSLAGSRPLPDQSGHSHPMNVSSTRGDHRRASPAAAPAALSP